MTLTSVPITTALSLALEGPDFGLALARCLRARPLRRVALMQQHHRCACSYAGDAPGATGMLTRVLFHSARCMPPCCRLRVCLPAA